MGRLMTTNLKESTDQRIRDGLMATGGFVLGGTLAAAFTHMPGDAAAWASWVQAIGALLALGVAVGIAFWQWRASVAATVATEATRRREGEEAHIRVLETARDVIDRMEFVVASIHFNLQPANRAGFNLRASVQTIVTLGDILKSVPVFDIRSGAALDAVVGAQGEIDRYRAMAFNGSYNDTLSEIGVFQKYRQKLDDIIAEATRERLR
jgi:hypothetical protein